LVEVASGRPPAGTLPRIGKQLWPATSTPKLVAIARVITWTLMVFTVTMAVLSKWSASYVWDDSFMFVRYADNIISCHQLSWNPCGIHTYGLTSLLFLVVVVPIRLLFPKDPALCALLSSVISGFAFLFLLIVLLERNVRASPLRKQIVALMVSVSVYIAVGPLTTHFVSGMDTTFVMAYLTAYILFISGKSQSLSRTSVFISGILGGLSFLARPDLLLYATVVPLSMVFLEQQSDRRKEAAAILGLSVAISAGLVFTANWYFGSPVPLGFFVKGLRSYGDNIYQVYNSTSFHALISYILYYGIFFGALVLNIWTIRSSLVKHTWSLEIGLLIATLSFLIYYTFFVLQIMYYASRFYYPTLPAVIYLGATSLTQMASRGNCPGLIRTGIERNGRVLLGSLLIVMVGFLGLASETFSQRLFRIRPTALVNGNFSLVDEYRLEWRAYWFKLEDFSALPNDLVIASTEVGRLGAMNPQKKIVDLTGLNEPYIAKLGFQAERFFRKYQPDLIYLPHPDYAETIREITNCEYFKEFYVWFPAAHLETRLGVAIRKDSRYYGQMLKIMGGAVSVPQLSS
jgi:hypothetical protein